MVKRVLALAGALALFALPVAACGDDDDDGGGGGGGGGRSEEEIVIGWTPPDITGVFKTATDFFERAGMADDTAIGTMEKDDPAQVAEQAFEAIMRGEKKVVTGSLKTKVQGLAGKVLPDGVKAVAHRRMAEPGSANEEGKDARG